VLLVLTALLLTLGLSSTAFAEYLNPYPSYTHSTPSGGSETAVDPLNALFGGTYSNGYYGTPEGAYAQLHQDLGCYFGSGGVQYVKFQSNIGNYEWRDEIDTYINIQNQDYQVRLGNEYGDNNHLRLFRDPYPTYGGSYANKNSVADIHHEEWRLTPSPNHHIDEDW
jgi:hypothetical protein